MIGNQVISNKVIKIKGRVARGKGQEKTHYDCQLAPVLTKGGAGRGIA
jgi:hypothetical protein